MREMVKASQELYELRAENKKLRQDQARLDWLETQKGNWHGFSIEPPLHPLDGLQLCSANLGSNGVYGDTLRGALDAVMQKGSES